MSFLDRIIEWTTWSSLDVDPLSPDATSRAGYVVVEGAEGGWNLSPDNLDAETHSIRQALDDAAE